MTTIAALQGNQHLYLKNLAGTGEAEAAATKALTDQGRGTDEASIRAFQADHNLKVDGKIGQETLGELMKRVPTVEASNKPVPAGQARVSMATGANGAAASLQALLPPKKPKVELGTDGKLLVQGTDKSESIHVNQDGDKLRVSIRDLKDGGLTQAEFNRDDVRSLEILAGGGNDMVFNGKQETRGVDNATIKLGGEERGGHNAVYSYADNVEVVGGQAESLALAAKGDNVRTSGTSGADSVAIDGNNAAVGLEVADTAAAVGSNNRVYGAGNVSASTPLGAWLRQDGADAFSLDPDQNAAIGAAVSERVGATVKAMNDQEAKILVEMIGR